MLKLENGGKFNCHQGPISVLGHTETRNLLENIDAATSKDAKKTKWKYGTLVAGIEVLHDRPAGLTCLTGPTRCNR
eukprot:m.448259 g.448259  ORF g.448259 m.448259 type:complete len:76 (-) comp19635_c0_seq1:2014-2241(-)